MPIKASSSNNTVLIESGESGPRPMMVEAIAIAHNAAMVAATSRSSNLNAAQMMNGKLRNKSSGDGPCVPVVISVPTTA